MLELLLLLFFLLQNASEKYTKSDREDFIEVIENIKSKAHNDKSALKKALK